MNHTHTQTQGGLRLPTSGRLLRWLFSIVGIAAIASAAVAQTGTITGRVINKGTNDYVKYAEVKIVGTEKTTTTDAEGSYTLTGVAAGEVKLSVSYPSLDTAEVTVTVTADATVKQDVELTSADYGDVVTLAAVRVAGARAGNAKALLEQKQALNFKSVISADAFGDIPEGNIGEFVKNLPGMSVDYVEADVRNVRVRGLPPKYATFTVDGLPIANSGSSDLTRLRAQEMEQISLAVSEAQEVNKSPTADMIASGLGGNINAVGKSAFSKKGRTLKYSVSAVFNEYRMTTGETQGWDAGTHHHAFPNASFEFGDVFLDGKLGVVFAVSHSGSYMQQKILENSLSFNQPTSAITQAEVDSNSSAIAGKLAQGRNVDNEWELPTYTQIRLRDGPKPTWRDAAVLNLDYKLTDDLKLTWRSSFGGYNAKFFNHDMNWRTGTASRPDNNTQIVTGGNVQVASSNSKKTGKTFILSPGAEWKVGSLKFSGAVSYSRSENKYYAAEEGFFRAITAQKGTTTTNNVNWSYTKTGDTGFHMKQNAGGGTGSVFDLNTYNSLSVQQEGRKTYAQTYAARGDVELAFSEWSVPTTFKTGVAYRLDMVDLNNSGPTWTVDLARLSTLGLSLGDFQMNFPAWVGKGADITDVNGVTSKYNTTIDNYKLFSLFKQYVSDFTGTSTGDFQGPFQANQAANLRSILQQNSYIEEEVQAAYVMATVKPISKLTVLAGLRFEKTNTTGRVFDDKGRVYAATKVLAAKGVVPLGANGTYTTTQLNFTTTTNATFTSSGYTTNDLDFIHARYGSRTKRERDYDNILPSAQGKYQLTKDVNLKATYFKSLLRPDHGNLKGGVTVNDNTGAPFAFTRSNIDLETETADNFEVGAEYYIQPQGVISFNAWYKKLKDLQLNILSTIDPNNIPEDVAALGFDANTLGASSTITQRLNGGSTVVKGAEFVYDQELSFLPGIWRGLGLRYNLSYAQAEDDLLFASSAAANTASGGGMAKWNTNLNVSYKYSGFKIQLSANYNSKKLISVDNANYNSDGSFNNRNPGFLNQGLIRTYEKPRTILGVNMSYEVKKYAVLFLNVQNLTNEPQTRYMVRELNTSRDGDYGAVYNVGVKGSF